MVLATKLFRQIKIATLIFSFFSIATVNLQKYCFYQTKKGFLENFLYTHYCLQKVASQLYSQQPIQLTMWQTKDLQNTTSNHFQNSYNSYLEQLASYLPHFVCVLVISNSSWLNIMQTLFLGHPVLKASYHFGLNVILSYTSNATYQLHLLTVRTLVITS